MTAKRFVPAFVVAFTVTSGLFVVMSRMIESDAELVEEPPIIANVTLTEPIDDVPVEPVTPPPTPPEPPVLPPLPDVTQAAEPFSFAGIGFLPPSPRTKPITPASGLADGPMLPILTAAPTYPERLLRSGVEGYVILEFVVDELGRVQTPRVIEAQPRRVFDKAALDAVRRYKYKPRVIGGSAVRVQGVRQKITFELS